MAHKLTDQFVRDAAPGFYRDGGCPTLSLRVTPAHTRQWVQRLAARGRARQLGLGGYPLVGLAEAREQAMANSKLARAGGEPRPSTLLGVIKSLGVRLSIQPDG